MFHTTGLLFQPWKFQAYTVWAVRNELFKKVIDISVFVTARKPISIPYLTQHTKSEWISVGAHGSLCVVTQYPPQPQETLSITSLILTQLTFILFKLKNNRNSFFFFLSVPQFTTSLGCWHSSRPLITWKIVWSFLFLFFCLSASTFSYCIYWPCQHRVIAIILKAELLCACNCFYIPVDLKICSWN